MISVQPELETEGLTELNHRRRPGAAWRQRLQNAHKGFKIGVRGHPSFFRHFFFVATIFAAGFVLRCSEVEWCCLIGGIALVLITEMFNSAIETICRSVAPPLSSGLQSAIHIGDAAVLFASGAAVLMAAIIFLDRIVVLFS